MTETEKNLLRKAIKQGNTNFNMVNNVVNPDTPVVGHVWGIDTDNTAKFISQTEITTNSSTYVVDNDWWGIYNDGTHAVETTDNINLALQYAVDNHYEKVIFVAGTYLIYGLVEINEGIGDSGWVYHGITIPSNLWVHGLPGAKLQLETTEATHYNVVTFERGGDNIKLSGFEIVGDKDTHVFQITSVYESGTLNSITGGEEDDASYIRSDTLDIIEHSDLFTLKYKSVYVTKNNDVTATTFDAYFYNSSGIFISRVTGKPFSGTCGTLPAGTQYIRFVLQQANSTNVETYSKNGVWLTAEFGAGVLAESNSNFKIFDVNVHSCTGDAITLGCQLGEPECSWGVIRNCELHNSMRQGLTIGGVQNSIVEHCNFHDISGYAPGYGIDMEAGNATKTNRFVTVKDSYFADCVGGVNLFDGEYCSVENCFFERINPDGSNKIAIVSSYSSNCSIIHNTILNGLINVWGVSTTSVATLISQNKIYIGSITITSGSAFIRICDNFINGGKIYIAGNTQIRSDNNTIISLSATPTDIGYQIMTASDGVSNNDVVIGEFTDYSIQTTIGNTYTFTFNGLQVKNYKQAFMTSGRNIFNSPVIDKGNNINASTYAWRCGDNTDINNGTFIGQLQFGIARDGGTVRIRNSRWYYSANIQQLRIDNSVGNLIVDNCEFYIPSTNTAGVFWLTKGNLIVKNSIFEKTGTVISLLTSNDLTNVSVENCKLSGVTWTKQARNLNKNNDFGYKIFELSDDFLQQSIVEVESPWIFNKGTDAEALDPAIYLQAGGTLRLQTGDNSGALTDDGSQVVCAIPVKASYGDLEIECKLKINTAIAGISVNVGLTDTNALEEPFEISGTTITSNATDAACFVYDDGATTKEWYACCVDSDIDDTGNGTTAIAPVADTYQTFKIIASADGNNIGFAISSDGGYSYTVAKTLTNAGITPNVPLYFTVVANSTTTASKIVDVDFIKIRHKEL